MEFFLDSHHERIIALTALLVVHHLFVPVFLHGAGAVFDENHEIVCNVLAQIA